MKKVCMSSAFLARGSVELKLHFTKSSQPGQPKDMIILSIRLEVNYYILSSKPPGMPLHNFEEVLIKRVFAFKSLFNQLCVLIPLHLRSLGQMNSLRLSELS